MNAGRLDRRITVLQPINPPADGYGRQAAAFQAVARLWAARRDISDGERITAGQMQSSRTVRFTVRDSATARAIGPTHRLEHEGQTYHVAHAKEALDQGRRRYIEITAGLIDT